MRAPKRAFGNFFGYVPEDPGKGNKEMGNKIILTCNYEEDMETIKGLADGTSWRDEDDITWKKGELLQGYLCAFDTTVFAGEYIQV